MLPGHSADDGEALLGAVHDRLGRDGLYVLVDYHGGHHQVAFEVKAPAEDALTVASYEPPYQPGPLAQFREVRRASPRAARRRPPGRRLRASGTATPAPARTPEARFIGPTDRENQAFLTGIALTGVPLLILLLGFFVRRWRRRLPWSRGNPSSGNLSRLPRGALPGIALVTAVAIALGASLTFDQTTSSAAQGADLAADLWRVSTGW